ncbi:MAG: hypothetical protein Tsb0020_36630 [Haliangiales bacterium]
MIGRILPATLNVGPSAYSYTEFDLRVSFDRFTCAEVSSEADCIND